MFRFRKNVEVTVAIAEGVLESIFDECDRYDADETGGRIIGTYKQKDAKYHIQVSCMLGPGPNADRSPTYFMQDGEYQERQFRAIEAKHPDIEHLGNWHTHHVNGYPTLSGGDKTTYHKIVNHKNHNTDFFYALLVTKRNARGNPRYDIKHFLLRRGDNEVYEIPHTNVKVVKVPTLTAGEDAAEVVGTSGAAHDHIGVNAERAKDQEFFAEHYPDLKALISKSSGAPYWKGPLELVDGTQALVVAMENADIGKPSYSVTAAGDIPALASVKAKYEDRHFRSARDAVIRLERDLNKAIYREIKGS